MFYKMLFDRFVGFAYLYTVLDMPRQIRIVCLHKDAVLCFVNNGLADKTSTEPGLDGASHHAPSIKYSVILQESCRTDCYGDLLHWVFTL